MTRTHDTAPTGHTRSIGTSRTTILNNLLHGLLLCGTLLGLAFTGLTGCDYPDSGELLTSNPDESEEVDADAESITISGHTTTVDGFLLPGSWVGIADDLTQELISETTSDQNGVFTITLNGAIGDYTMLATYQEDDLGLITWQSFNISDLDQDLTFDLSLFEADEGADDGARSGGCYRVYFGSSWCSNHRLYRYYELSGAWYCSLVNARVGQVGCC